MLHLIFLALLFTASPKGDTTIVTGSYTSSTVNKTVLLQLVNDARKNGCQCGSAWYSSAPAVVWNDVLEKAAMAHSTDMNRKKFFSHTSSVGMGAGQRLTAIGYNWRTYGENIAQGYANEKEVVAGWLKSPGHCANIMSKDYKEMGVANIDGYWTQDFGARQ